MGGGTTCYLVTLTPHEIKRSESIPVSRSVKIPLRSKIFIRFMKIFGWAKEIRDHHALFAEIKIKEVLWRVCNLHLRSNTPAQRLKEWRIMSKYLSKSSQKIACGDFNIVDSSLLKPVNWIMGAPIKQGLPWYPERKNMEYEFEKLGLMNPLRGRNTHKFTPNQFDHVLVPTDSRAVHHKVFKQSFGSDHYPVFVEIE